MATIKTTKTKYLLCLLIPPLAILIYFNMRALNQHVKQMQYQTGVSTLDTAFREMLNEYYEQNGFYPDTLDKLPSPFPCDCADPSMLKLFTYTTDGRKFSLILTTNPQKGYRYEYIGERGEMVEFNEYVGDKLMRSEAWKGLGPYSIRF
jgi:hypothetical protein